MAESFVRQSLFIVGAVPKGGPFWLVVSGSSMSAARPLGVPTNHEPRRSYTFHSSFSVDRHMKVWDEATVGISFNTCMRKCSRSSGVLTSTFSK